MRRVFIGGFRDDVETQDEETKQVIAKLPEIDLHIVKAAPQWPLNQMNKVDIAILRISVYELLSKDTPENVVIDEAVEIAKEYGAEHSPSFVNGVLATIVKTLQQ